MVAKKKKIFFTNKHVFVLMTMCDASIKNKREVIKKKFGLNNDQAAQLMYKNIGIQKFKNIYFKNYQAHVLKNFELFVAKETK